MENILVVSSSEKGASIISEMLSSSSPCQITAVKSCGEARRMLLERVFDLIIVDAPLRDESGETFARDVASKEISEVILIVKREFYEAVAEICEPDGVLTIPKPLNKSTFWTTLSLARAMHSRVKRMQAENDELRRKMEDNRLVSRAKCLLVSLLNMSEKEAHRYIEKQAMDLRITKRAVAERIIEQYDD